MIASIPRKTGDTPRSFKGTVQYVLRADHDARVVGGTVVGYSGEPVAKPTEILREFEAIRRRRPEVNDPVVHMSLSFAPGDRRLSQAELAEIADRFVTRLGYRRCPYVVVEHNDRSHQHLHIVLSRIRLDGSLNPRPHNDWFKAMQVCRQLEHEYGLTRVERPRETGLRAPTRGEIEHGAKSGQLSERMLLQQVIMPVAQSRPSLPEFVDALQGLGISVRFHLGPDKRPIGVSYHSGKYPFAGSALGPSYTFRGIQREGVQVDPKRDVGLIRELAVAHPDMPRATAREMGSETAARLRATITGALDYRPSLSVFVERLQAAGVQVQMNVASTGYVSGVRFVFEGSVVRGSQLGREFSIEGLRRQGLDVSPERDAPLIAALAVSPSSMLAGRPRPLTLDDARDAVREALRDRPDVATFVERLHERGIRPRFHTNASGHPVAISYRTDADTLQARDLGEAYRWPNLAITYSHAEHRAIVAANSAKTPKRGNQESKTDERLIRILEGAAQGSPSLTTFIARVEDQSVRARLLLDKDGGIVAIHYRSDRGWTAGKDLDESFTWRGLRSKGVRYDAVADNGAVARVGELLPTPRTLSPEQLAPLARMIADASADRPKIADFLARLHAADVGVSLYGPRVGAVHAIAYTFEGVRISGRELGDAYRWQTLQVFRVDHEDDVAVRRVLEILPGDIGPRKAEVEHVQGSVLTAAVGRPDLTTFIERLRGDGVGVRLLTDGRGHIETIVYRTDDRWISARALGDEFTWGQIRRLGVYYDPARDAGTLAQLGEPSALRKTLDADQLVAVQAAITDAVMGRPDITTFVDRLAERSIGVRFALDDGERVTSARFDYQGVTVGGRQIGQIYSWPNLVASGLRHDAARDAGTIRSRMEPPVPVRRLTRGETQYVRAAVAAAVLERPTLTQFVDRLADRAIDVRLYVDAAGEPFAIGYGFNGAGIAASDMGESYRWRQITAAGVSVEPERDKQVLDQVAVHIQPRDFRTLYALHIADQALYAASLVRVQLHRAEMLMHDPVGLALEIGIASGIDLARQGVAGAIENVTEHLVDQLRERERRQAAATVDRSSAEGRQEAPAAHVDAREEQESRTARADVRSEDTSRTAADRESQRAEDPRSELADSRRSDSTPADERGPAPEPCAPGRDSAEEIRQPPSERTECERPDAQEPPAAVQPSRIDEEQPSCVRAAEDAHRIEGTDRAGGGTPERGQNDAVPSEAKDHLYKEPRRDRAEAGAARNEEQKDERNRDERLAHEPDGHRGQHNQQEQEPDRSGRDGRAQAAAPAVASDGAARHGHERRGADIERDDRRHGEARAESERTVGRDQPDSRPHDGDRREPIARDERHGHEKPAAGREQPSVTGARDPVPARGHDADLRPAGGHPGRGDEALEQAVRGDRAHAPAERVPAGANGRDVPEGARTAVPDRDAAPERGRDAERWEARAPERGVRDQPIHRPEIEVRSDPAARRQPAPDAERSRVVERDADHRRTSIEHRESVVDRGERAVDHGAATGSRDVAPPAAQDASRERLLEAIASLQKQNDVQESRLPLRPPSGSVSHAEDISRLGQTAASLVRNVRNPAQMKDLAEHPEKAPLAAAKEVAAKLAPIGAPVSKAVDGIAKQIDRSTGADHDR